jgi:hypothetical protein
MGTFLIAVGSTVAGFLAVLLLEMLGQHSVTRLLTRAGEWARARRIATRRQLYDAGHIDAWLLDYYAGTDRQPGLATISSDGRTRHLPLYAPDDWLVRGRAAVLQSDRDIFENDGTPRQEGGPMPRVVRQRQALSGKPIWDGDALVAPELPTAYDAPLAVQNVGYFERVEPLIRLEEEAIRCAGSRWRRRSPYRDDLVAGRLRPGHGVGCTAVFVLDFSDGEPHVLLHRRSTTVATNPGRLCTTPSFVVEDPSASGLEPSRVGLMPSNLIREVLEEAYGLQDAEQWMGQANVDWFLRSGYGSDLEELHRRGRLDFVHLGWCLDLMGGFVNVLTLIHVHGSKQELDWLLFPQASASEMTLKAGELKFVPLFGAIATQRMLDPMFHPPGALAMDLARGVLSQKGHRNNVGRPKSVSRRRGSSRSEG